MLTPAETRALVVLIGYLVQLVATVLLVAFFFALRRNTLRRDYFGLWTWGWFALAASSVILVLRHQAVPGVDTRLAGPVASPSTAALFASQTAWLVGLALLAGGAVRYASGHDLRARRGLLAAGAVAYALACVLLRAEPHLLVLLQAAVAVAACGAGGVPLLRLAPSRRTLGSRVTGTAFLAGGTLWLGYAVVLGARLAIESREAAAPLARALPYASFLTALVAMVLGLGMVVILLEDARREADDAHAQLAVAHDRLRREALQDSLTGVPNRRAFAEGVGLDAAKATFGTVVMLDVDNLKEVNDAHGHAAGDTLLKALADTLRTTLRPSDRVFRWGGDEFVLVLPGARASEVVPRVEQTLAGASPIVAGEEQSAIPVLASVGAADYAGAEQLLSALAKADEAMYRAKRARKGANARSQDAA